MLQQVADPDPNRSDRPPVDSRAHTGCLSPPEIRRFRPAPAIDMDMAESSPVFHRQRCMSSRIRVLRIQKLAGCGPVIDETACRAITGHIGPRLNISPRRPFRPGHPRTSTRKARPCPNRRSTVTPRRAAARGPEQTRPAAPQAPKGQDRQPPQAAGCPTAGPPPPSGPRRPSITRTAIALAPGRDRPGRIGAAFDMDEHVGLESRRHWQSAKSLGRCSNAFSPRAGCQGNAGKGRGIRCAKSAQRHRSSRLSTRRIARTSVPPEAHARISLHRQL